jgi:hypothetical protein
MRVIVMAVLADGSSTLIDVPQPGKVTFEKAHHVPDIPFDVPAEAFIQPSREIEFTVRIKTGERGAQVSITPPPERAPEWL